MNLGDLSSVIRAITHKLKDTGFVNLLSPESSLNRLTVSLPFLSLNLLNNQFCCSASTKKLLYWLISPSN
uniref:Uncharacterized protein n=1 Tax=uncultured delta proteobacterium HF0010_08B07 TaxID=710821 RepID=E0XWV0_9DELT|nr:hypothetical protein [uncultured delta proteobacterium HF0010_08B07]